MKAAFMLPVAAAVAQVPVAEVPVGEVPLAMSWNEWKATFGVDFNGNEDSARQLIYETNVAFIETENTKDHAYVLGVNQFSHLAEEEFLTLYAGAKDAIITSDDDTYLGRWEEGIRADSVDWTTSDGVITPVKDQGQCGSCWAFSAVGVVESANALATGHLWALSEQQLLDCEDWFQSGCGGGYNDKALTYISKYGACSQESYPYEATDYKDNTCKAGSTEHGQPGKAECTFGVEAGVISGYSDLAKNVIGLETGLNQMPVSVTIRADGTFQSYRSGVLSENCPFMGQVNHAVIAVGYDNESFKIRNSWGSSWGEGGYVRMAKDKAIPNPYCLFAHNPVVPTMSVAAVMV